MPVPTYIPAATGIFFTAFKTFLAAQLFFQSILGISRKTRMSATRFFQTQSCQVCALALSSPDPPYITRLLLADGEELANNICSQCRRQQREATVNSKKPARALHVMNELVTPEVNYESWKEFVELVYAVQDNYCACMLKAVHKEMQRDTLSAVLGRVFSFPMEMMHLRENGPAIIMQLTKNQGMFWCQMVAHLVYTRVRRAASIFNDVVAALNDNDNERFCSAHTLDMLLDVMQQEVRHTFSGAMPFSIYTLCSGFVSTLLVRNFTFYDNHELTAFTDTQFRALLLALCMGAHARLGAKSPLLAFHDDILQSICARLSASQLTKHIVFHTQEQWLVA